MMRSSARHFLRSLGQKFPQLRNVSGKLGLGRLVAPSNSFEQIIIDDDVTIEFDLSVPIFRHIYFHHDLTESPEVQIMRVILKPDQTCIDVGAHIGYFSLVAAKYSRQVIAFEPSPTTFKMLKRNLALNPSLAPKIRAVECGLSDRAGGLTLYNSKSHPGLASLAPIGVADGYTQEIMLVTLDECVTESDGPITFIKIDVEGAELGVLEGSKNSISKHRPIIMLELFDEYQRRFGHTCADVVEMLTSRDYQPYLIVEPGPKLQELKMSHLSDKEVNNTIFAPKEKTQLITGLMNKGITT